MTYKITVSESGQKNKVITSSFHNYNVIASYPLNYKTIFDGDLGDYDVKSQENFPQNVTFNYTLEIMPQYLDELVDVEISEINGAQDKYVLVYNASTQKWQAVNPDNVLSAAATEPIQPGLPTEFTDEVSVDGGTF